MRKTYQIVNNKGILECETLSLQYSKIAEHEKFMKKAESMGIEVEEQEELYPDSTRAVLNFAALGDIMFFNETEVELYEKDNFTPATFLQFKSDFEIVVLVPFEEFKKIYYEYLESKV
jgi:hypothetical protein